MVWETRSFHGHWLQKFEYFEVGEETIITNIHPESVQLSDRFKDQGEELIEFNLAEEWEEAQPIFLNASSSSDLKKSSLDLLRELKDVFGMDICWDAQTWVAIGPAST